MRSLGLVQALCLARHIRTKVITSYLREPAPALIAPTPSFICMDKVLSDVLENLCALGSSVRSDGP